MKTAQASALNNKGKAELSGSLSDSYMIKAQGGRMIQATPLKFCLNFSPPTIAVVYTLSNNSKSKKSGKIRKYVKEIEVDFKACMAMASTSGISMSSQTRPTISQLEKLVDKLCKEEPTYLNINVISKTQVLNLIKKLYAEEFKCAPETTPRDTKAPDAASNPTRAGALGTAETKSKEKEDKAYELGGNISDDYDDDFDEAEEQPKAKADGLKEKAEGGGDDAKKAGALDMDDADDDWDMDDDDMGELDNKGNAGDKKGASSGVGGVNPQEIADKKRRDLFFGAGTDDLNDLEELDMIGGKDFDNKNEDKFNQVLSTSKENGGLLASIGLKKGGEHDESLCDES